jgi:hypothetical protein
MTNWNGQGRKQAWCVVKNQYGVCLEGRRKLVKNIRTAGLAYGPNLGSSTPEYRAGVTDIHN